MCRCISPHSGAKKGFYPGLFAEVTLLPQSPQHVNQPPWQPVIHILFWNSSWHQQLMFWPWRHSQNCPWNPSKQGRGMPCSVEGRGTAPRCPRDPLFQQLFPISPKQKAAGWREAAHELFNQPQSYKINSFDMEGKKASNKQKKNSMCSFSVDQSVQVHSYTKSICSSAESLRKGRTHHGNTSTQLSRLSQWWWRHNAFYLVHRTLRLPDQEGSWFLSLLVYEGKSLQSSLPATLKMDFSVVFSLPLPQNQASLLTKITFSCTKELKTGRRTQKYLSSAQ